MWNFGFKAQCNPNRYSSFPPTIPCIIKLYGLFSILQKYCQRVTFVVGLVHIECNFKVLKSCILFLTLMELPPNLLGLLSLDPPGRCPGPYQESNGGPWTQARRRAVHSAPLICHFISSRNSSFLGEVGPLMSSSDQFSFKRGYATVPRSIRKRLQAEVTSYIWIVTSCLSVKSNYS